MRVNNGAVQDGTSNLKLLGRNESTNDDETNIKVAAPRLAPYPSLAEQPLCGQGEKFQAAGGQKIVFYAYKRMKAMFRTSKESHCTPNNDYLVD